MWSLNYIVKSRITFKIDQKVYKKFKQKFEKLIK